MYQSIPASGADVPQDSPRALTFCEKKKKNWQMPRDREKKDVQMWDFFRAPGSKHFPENNYSFNPKMV